MITVNMAATGANIKNMMKARNIKVKDVQAVCGFGTPQAIFKWMRGDCMPTIDNMLIIADMFGCTMDDIVVVNKKARLMVQKNTVLSLFTSIFNIYVI